jgi:hypothetical protein
VPLTAEQVEGLGVALNEADWHDLTIDEPAATVDVLLTVLSRDETGEETTDPRRTLRLGGVSRVVASYRAGPWDDPDAAVLPLDADGLREVLRRNGGTPIYGWEFVDSDDRSWPAWRQRLSLDLALGGTGGHHLTLFQDLQGRAHLDFRAWFSDVSVRDGDGARLDIDEFIAGGVRWWDAMYAGERSDLAPGIVSAAPELPKPHWWDRFRRTSE